MKKIIILFFLLAICIECKAQKDGWTGKNKIEKQNELNPKVLKDTLVSLKVDSILVSQLKKELYEDYKKSKSFDQKELTKESEKQILAVSWYDSEFNKIKATVRGELISIVFLTRGYKIGDKVEVSIGDKDENSKSLLENEKCHMITFIGHVTHENLAVMQNIFTVEGEKEYIVVNAAWLNSCKCK